MSKKDFSQDSADVFSSMFSKSTIKEVDKKEKGKKEENRKTTSSVSFKSEEIPVKVIKPKELSEAIDIISQKKSKRFNFYLEDNLTEYFNNIKWIKRVKNTSDYINNLIREDFIKTLALPEDSNMESIQLAWNKYKKKNNI